MDAIQIGQLYLNWKLVTLIASAAIAYGVMILSLRIAAIRQEPYGDLLFNTLIIGFLSWKFAPIVLHPLSFLSAPLKLIMTPGGAKEWWIALLVVLLYISYSYLRRKISLLILADLLAYGVLSFIGAKGIIGGWVYGLQTNMPWGIRLADGQFAYHPINVYEIIVSCIVFAIIWRSQAVPGKGKAVRIVLMYGSVGLFAISLLNASYAMESFLYLTYPQWLYIGFILCGLFFPQWLILWASIQKRSRDI